MNTPLVMLGIMVVVVILAFIIYRDVRQKTQYEKRRVPTNTSVLTKKELLTEVRIIGAENFIPWMEVKGQQELIYSATLPTDMPEEAKSALIKAGVKFRGLVSVDPLFQYVRLPRKWEKREAGNSLWTYLLDDKGRKRALIYYNAAFNNRSARLKIRCRYQIAVDQDRYRKEGVAVARVMDGNIVIYTTNPVKMAHKKIQWGEIGLARNIATDWLNTNFPEWRDCSAYWD